MALLKSYGVGNEEIIKDYLRTNRNAFWPTIKKSHINNVYCLSEGFRHPSKRVLFKVTPYGDKFLGRLFRFFVYGF